MTATTPDPTTTGTCTHVTYANPTLARNTAWLLKTARRVDLRPRCCTRCGQWRLTRRRRSS